MRSDAETVEQYLSNLSDERRDAIGRVREVILANLPDGYEEAMNWGMITYQVPLERQPGTYNGRPLMYAALASQKRHMAVYLMGVYAAPETREAFLEACRASGKRPDTGKSCVRFRRLEDLPLEAVGDAIAAYPIDEYIALVEAQRSR